MTVDEIKAAESALVQKVTESVAAVEQHRQEKIAEHEALLAGLHSLIESAQASVAYLERATAALRNLSLS